MWVRGFERGVKWLFSPTKKHCDKDDPERS